MTENADIRARAPSPAKFAHAVLRTKDRYREMVDWYRTVLNARTVFANEMLTFITYDDEHHRIAIAHDPSLDERDGRRVGLDHLAFTYAGIDDLLSTYQRLDALGIRPFCPVNHGPTTSLYYHDPDGNRIELQIDNFDDMEEATGFMHDAFAVNPVGVLVDPSHLLDGRARGRSGSELTRLSVDDLSPPEAELITRLMSD